MGRLHPVRWLGDRPRIADWLLALGMTAMSLVAHVTVHYSDTTRPRWYSVIFAVVAVLPVGWRRTAPVVAVVLTLLGQMALEAWNFEGPGWLGVIVATYSLSVYASRRQLWWAASSAIVASVAFVIIGVIRGDAPWQSLITVPVAFAGALASGDNARRRRQRAAELVERAERAERERELVVHQQALDERARIARELHDVVAHSVSLMVIQAGAARRQLSHDLSASEAALVTVETTGRQAMTEMRRILGVLRAGGTENEAERAPQPSLLGLGDLVSAANDLPVELEVDGDLHELPAALDVSAYRIVQEALTNVRRHAGEVRRVEVSVRRHPSELSVVVRDDGVGAASTGSASAGFGLAGMWERVAAFAGVLTTGPSDGGGWQVAATFPLASSLLPDEL